MKGEVVSSESSADCHRNTNALAARMDAQLPPSL